MNAPALSYDFGQNGFLPPGRYSCTLTDAEDLLVHHPDFQGSTTRSAIWNNLFDFLAAFTAVEEKHKASLPGPLIDRIWLGGSFVSKKLDPNNADCTLWLNGEVVQALKGREGSGLLGKSRDHWLRTYGVSALIAHFYPVVKVFDERKLTSHELDYLRDRGRWDDWWQRTRAPGIGETVLASVPAKRGYLEVKLDD